MLNVTIQPLDETNWLPVCNLHISKEQEANFPIPNVYWIGISRYEEHTELFAIVYDEKYVGLIGCGLDEDGVSGFINPLMIDEKFQRKGIAKEAMQKAIQYLIDTFDVHCVNLGHRKSNEVAGKFYESLGFVIVGEDEQDYFRQLRI